MSNIVWPDPLAKIIYQDNNATIYKDGRGFSLKVSAINADTPIYRIKPVLDIMKTLSHPNIIKILDYNFRLDNETGITYLLILSNYLYGSTLLESVNNKTLTDTEKFAVSLQIFSAINYLHLRQLVHRDIKLENIIIIKSGGITLPVITDLNYSCTLSANCKGSVVSPMYADINMINSESNPDYLANDWYAYGVLLYIIFTGESPFENVPDVASMYKLKEDNKFFPMDTIYPDLNNLVNKMLNSNMKTRPTKNEIKELLIYHLHYIISR